MNNNNDYIKKIQATKDVKELKAIFNSFNLVLNDEEAAFYFDAFHKKGRLDNNELSNVAAGSQCRKGKLYSSDQPHYLIVTAGNKCDLYDENPSGGGIKGTCHHCRNMCHYSGSVTLYCYKRTYDNDPFNPK